MTTVQRNFSKLRLFWVGMTILGLFDPTLAFQNSYHCSIGAPVTKPLLNPLWMVTTNNEEDEAQKLLDRAAQLRAEIAQAEGKTLEQVQDEAKRKKDDEKRRIEQADRQRDAAKAQHNQSKDPGSYLVQVPNTVDDMVRQAARAVERAFQDGITRQTVRFNLVTENQSATEENEWPGGARQMYREAGKPLTDALLREIRAPTKKVDEMVQERRLAPTVKAQDIWDFDGSALHTAEAAEGASADIQALVFPNTDTKYLDDISKISEAMGSRLFLLVNPFWRNVDSWSFNLLAPGAKRKAQEVVFDQGFNETYSLMVFQVRGENCVAVKAYPYDWQLFAFREDDYYVNQESILRLGSTKEEPTSALVTELINSRPEFKDTRTMRQMKKNIQR
ncbi:DUF1995 domain containing protein [Nitzschia inconspicua]|uniref:DUF1995 domain containing protein n=1 Tax=Nitzschia inconspicua TaxID=303405 RepID=A0A9K3M1P2_9STRA|nr:DUF1995 domain containing protein [Nitzschia inconspicua]